MTGDQPAGDDATKEELREELRETRSRVRELESELAETNEGMVALTLELENAKERYQTIFEESTDGILLIDPDQDAISEANPQACELLGYDRETLVTLSPADIFPDEHDRGRTFAEAVVQGWGDDLTCRTNGGRKIDVDISASKITLYGQSLLLASLRDVTARKRREQRLEVLTRIFRHNLRNEGNVIQGHADLLFDELSDTAAEESVRQIRDTIDDILELSSKVRRIQDVLDRTQVHRSRISELLTDRQEWFEQTYPEASLTTQFPDREAYVDRRLDIAIQEAIENATKHTEMDPVISMATEIPDDTDQVRIEIEDDGPGLPEHELEVMRSGDETPQTHGSGIGLWCIQWVVDSIGGELTIQQGEPTGTIISITAPLETGQDTPELWH